MAETRRNSDLLIEKRNADEEETVLSHRRTVGAPRVQPNRTEADARAERRPASLEEIEARQSAISETRRPTKALDGRAGKNPAKIAVPDVAPTPCGKK